jgi:hypothetical protein
VAEPGEGAAVDVGDGGGGHRAAASTIDRRVAAYPAPPLVAGALQP